MNILKNEKGFTLIELVLIVIILGVLAAVATVQFGTIISDSKKSSIEAAPAAFSTQLALALNTIKQKPTANATGANSFGVEVFDKVSWSSSKVSKGSLTCNANVDCTWVMQVDASSTCQASNVYTEASGAIVTTLTETGC
ncbi:MAG: type II secretion system protein [Nitrospirae bacterium]|nr:type II secretion system protein [Nitrospirota bacterium]